MKIVSNACKYKKILNIIIDKVKYTKYNVIMKKLDFSIFMLVYGILTRY